MITPVVIKTFCRDPQMLGRELAKLDGGHAER
jgi:hypothetical protein